MNIQKKITTISILLMLLSCEISLIPLQNDYSSNKNCITCKEKRFFANRESKKDVFVSRGWGAGGMPFSVLYMNPSHSSKAPATSEGSYRSPPQQFANRQTEKSLPQVSNNNIA